MKGLEMLTGAMGFKPEMVQQGMQFLAGVEQAAKQMNATLQLQGKALQDASLVLIAIREQLVRIEANTMMLLEASEGVSPAAPTDYSVPALPALPPLDNEPRASVPVGE